MFDLAGLKHDKGYDDHNAAGSTDAINNTDVINIDRQLIKDAQEVVDLYKSGGIDPLSNEKVSRDEYQGAKRVGKIFTAIVKNKEKMINEAAKKESSNPVDLETK